jgi:hypothetical protein
MPNTWIIEQTEDRLLVARRKPLRWDVSARAAFPPCRPLTLAQQIRQDMWRRFQTLRGFTPIIEIADVQGGLHVTAGGQVDGCFPKANVEAQIADLLCDPKYRARWIRYASRSTRGSRPTGSRSYSGRAHA